MSRNPVGWFEIYVDNLARAQKFYETVLGVTLTELEAPEGDPIQMLAFPMDPEAPGAAGALVKMDGMSAAAAGTMIYFSCEDCAVQAHRIPDAGGQIEKEKVAIGQYGYMAIGRDTEGNTLGLHSMK